MRSDKYLWKICMEIYTELYKQANPSLNFEEAICKGITEKSDWYMNYYLNQEKQNEIFNTTVKKYKCSRREIHRISKEIWLGAAPSSVKHED